MVTQNVNTENKPTGPLYLERLMSQSLSNSGKAISTWVCEHVELASRISLAELALHCDLSQPSVVRWCKALGFAGYKDFQHWLSRNLGSGTPFVHAAVDTKDTPWVILRKVIDTTQNALIGLGNQLTEDQLSPAVAALSKARRIEFYGQGNSGITAQDGAHKLFRLGMNAVAYSDPHIHSASAAMLGKTDVLVLISNSGRTLDLLGSASIAKHAGATLIALTAAHSALAAIADIVLPINPSEDPDVYAPMTTRITQLVVLDALAVAVALGRGPALADKLSKYKQLIAGKRSLPIKKPAK